MEDTGIRLEENGCLHTRLMACVLSLNPTSELLSEQETPDLESINPQKVNDAIKFSDTQVTELPAKLNVEKFSIVGADSVSIVSVFQVSATSRKVVQCHNSVCGIAAGNKRALDTVKTSLDMCEHLQLFRDFISQEEYRCEGIIFNEEDYENEIETEVGHLPDNKVAAIYQYIKYYCSIYNREHCFLTHSFICMLISILFPFSSLNNFPFLICAFKVTIVNREDRWFKSSSF